MTAISDQELSLLSITEAQVAFNSDQKKAIIDVLGVKHATDADMAVFFHMCRHTGLDPFRKDIYMIARQEYDSEVRGKVWKQTFQTGISGYRKLAERYARSRQVKLGKATFRYWDEQGEEYSAWWKTEPPAMIRATVYMGDEPVVWDARFTEYVPLKDEYEDVLDDQGKPVKGSNGKTETRKTGRRVPQGMWATRPTAQLEKCAEAGALRRACSEEFGDLYLTDEMQPVVNSAEAFTVIHETTVQVASGRDWLSEIAAATEAEQLREIYTESTKAGERSAGVTEAISAKVRELQAVATAEAAVADAEPEELGECILLGTDGEDPDDCTTHDHAPMLKDES